MANIMTWQGRAKFGFLYGFLTGAVVFALVMLGLGVFTGNLVQTGINPVVRDAAGLGLVIMGGLLSGLGNAVLFATWGWVAKHLKLAQRGKEFWAWWAVPFSWRALWTLIALAGGANVSAGLIGLVLSGLYDALFVKLTFGVVRRL